MIKGPMTGYRVIDLSRYGPGRYCTMLLADYGAEVITIEAPRVDSSLPAFLTDDTLPRYLAFNRNKKSMALDLKQEKGCEVVLKLISTADVLLEGFRPGVTSKLGLDYTTLKKINSRLIYCSLSGFGQDGPYSMRPGHDLNYMGFSGMLSLTGPENGPPTIIGCQIADLLGGFCQTTMAILMALLEREKSGQGQFVDLAILDGLVHALWVQGVKYLVTGDIPQKGQDITNGLSAGYNIYETMDGQYLTLGCFEPWFWERLCRLIGREDFIKYQYASGEKREEIFDVFRNIFKSKTRGDWLGLLEKEDIPCGPVNDLSQTFKDPQIIHRAMVLEGKHPTLGIMKQLGLPLKFSRTPGAVDSPPPSYGQHTEQILHELGFSEFIIKDLRRRKCIE